MISTKRNRSLTYFWHSTQLRDSYFVDFESCLIFRCLTALFTKPPDGLPPYRTGSGGRSVRRFPIDIFPFCRERPVTKEPAAL